jgi:transcriptional regulator with XRE-family HTH domain
MPNGADDYPDRNFALRAFIHEQMRLRGWNYAEFAKAVGTDGSVIARWIRDRRPSPAMVRQMAERLGVDEDELLVIVGHRSPAPREATPEHAALIAKLRQVTFNQDRYLTLEALLEQWRRREP